MLSLLVAGALAQEPAVVPPPPDPLELELGWRAPTGCPTAVEIERRIRALLPGDPAGEGVLVVDGEVTTTDDGVTLVLVSTFRGQTERRELHARVCSELGEATAVLLAVALEPGRAQEILASTPPPARAPDEPQAASMADPIAAPELEATTPSVTTSSETVAPPRSRRRGPFGWALRIAGGIEAGAVPPPTGALHAAAILEWPRARLEVHGVWLVPRTKTDGQGRGATYQLGAAGVRGCGRLFAGAVEFPLCAGAEAGAMRARTRPLAPREIQHGPWVGALASAGVARAWGPVGIWSAAEIVARILGTRFFVGDTSVLRQFVSFRLLVGIELRGSWIRGRRGQ